MEEESDQDDLAARLEKIVKESGIEDLQLIQTLIALLHRSVEYGRANRVLGENPDDNACGEYVDNVIQYYKTHEAAVSALGRNETEAWLALVGNFQMWANGYLISREIHGPLRQNIIDECVPNAVMAYLSSAYHYDTDFDAWLCVLVQNVCRKYIKDQLHASNRTHEEAVSYDKYEFMLELLSDTSEMDAQRRNELRAALLEAVENLSSEARKTLIILHYFEDCSFTEIAEKMNRSLNATYKLHFDALNELRGFIDDWL